MAAPDQDLTATPVSRLQLRYSLVREYVHHVQFRRVDESAAVRAMGSGRAGVHGDAAFSIVEGSASYVALEYMRTYSNHTKAEIVAAVDEYRGASPAAHWSVYEDPPRTTEELLHALEPGSESVAPLTISFEATNWSVSERSIRGRMGQRPGGSRRNR